ncbi:hypothetical protein AAVH_25474 [Aphelenchoides avenae]|nr:hypothetical protein AAVH_25474 [Aphelenchus avenae]
MSSDLLLLALCALFAYANSQCADKGTDCPRSAALCNHGAYAALMATECPLTCGKCQAQQQPASGGVPENLPALLGLHPVDAEHANDADHSHYTDHSHNSNNSNDAYDAHHTNYPYDTYHSNHTYYPYNAHYDDKGRRAIRA